jgi:hypothetical protein
MSSLFRRKKRSEDGQGDDDSGKKKGDWKRPASASLLPYFMFWKMLTELFSISSMVTNRYGIQAATTQSMAAHLNAKDCASNFIHYRSSLRTDRWSTDMGLCPGQSSKSF